LDLYFALLWCKLNKCDRLFYVGLSLGSFENRYISANVPKTDQVRIMFALIVVKCIRQDCVHTSRRAHPCILAQALGRAIGRCVWLRSAFESNQACWISQRMLWDRQFVQKFEEFPTMSAITMRISAMPSDDIGLFVAPCFGAPKASKHLQVSACFLSLEFLAVVVLLP